MRSAILLTIGIALLTGTSNPADDTAPQESLIGAPQPSRDSYVKIRVEVELRGNLVDSEEGVSLVVQNRVYNLFHPNEENPDWTRPVRYQLDFARAKDLRELAKVLHDKEVVVTGMGEVRQYVQKVHSTAGGVGQGGGPNHLFNPVPHWHLQQTVLVTSLVSAGNQ